MSLLFLRSLHRVYLYLALVALDCGVFLGLSPEHASAGVVMLGFLLFVATLYLLLAKALELTARAFSLPGNLVTRAKILLFLGIIFLSALQSIGQLTVKDLLALVPLITVGYFYLAYPNEARKKNAR